VAYISSEQETTEMVATSRTHFQWLLLLPIIFQNVKPSTSFSPSTTRPVYQLRTNHPNSEHPTRSKQHAKVSLLNAGTMSSLKEGEGFAQSKEEETEIAHTSRRKQYFATCIPGLANVLARELIQIGATNVEPSGTSGVYFSSDGTTDVDIGLKALLWLRTAHRIMEMITTTAEDDYYVEHPILTKDDLYNCIQFGTPVQDILGDGKGGLLTLSVNIISNGYVPKELCHSHYTALTVKNALVDKVRELRDDRPDVDLVDPDVPLVAVLRGIGGKYKNENEFDAYSSGGGAGVEVTLYRILHSGGSLHRRGYRASSESAGKIHKAAMKESLAAGLLLESGWDLLVNAAKEDGLPAVFVDPMAGSGTLSVEAAMIASDLAPGLMRMKCYNKIQRESPGETKSNPHRLPPAIRWKGADTEQWKELIAECEDLACKGLDWMLHENTIYHEKTNCIILANELHSSAVDLALSNIDNAGFSNFISVHEGDCLSWDLGGGHDEGTNSEVLIERAVIPGRTIIGTNPPWGLRLTEDVEASWYALNVFFRRECNSAEAWVLSGSKAATRILRMKMTRKVPIKTADEDLRWIQYHVFKKKPATVDNAGGEKP